VPRPGHAGQRQSGEGGVGECWRPKPRGADLHAGLSEDGD